MVQWKVRFQSNNADPTYYWGSLMHRALMEQWPQKPPIGCTKAKCACSTNGWSRQRTERLHGI